MKLELILMYEYGLYDEFGLYFDSGMMDTFRREQLPSVEFHRLPRVIKESGQWHKSSGQRLKLTIRSHLKYFRLFQNPNLTSSFCISLNSVPSAVFSMCCCCYFQKT